MATINTAPTAEEIVEALTYRCPESDFWGTCKCGRCVDNRRLNDEGKLLAKLFLKQLNLSINAESDD